MAFSRLSFISDADSFRWQPVPNKKNAGRRIMLAFMVLIVGSGSFEGTNKPIKQGGEKGKETLKGRAITGRSTRFFL